MFVKFDPIVNYELNIAVQIFYDVSYPKYFRVYNSANLSKATKMARLRFDCERYVDTETPDQWKLSKDELKLLMKLLLTEFEGIAMWRWLVLSYRIETSCVGEPPRLPENTVMPNYLELCL